MMLRVVDFPLFVVVLESREKRAVAADSSRLENMVFEGCVEEELVEEAILGCKKCVDLAMREDGRGLYTRGTDEEEVEV